jgi:hypothetical protein
MGGPGGHPPIGESIEGRLPPRIHPGVESGQAPSWGGGFRGRSPMEDKMESTRRHDFRSGRGPGERPHGNMRMVEGHDGIISLRNVIPYTFILAFYYDYPFN